MYLPFKSLFFLEVTLFWGPRKTINLEIKKRQRSVLFISLFTSLWLLWLLRFSIVYIKWNSSILLQISLRNIGKVVVLGGTSQSEKGKQPGMEDRYLSRQGSGVWRSLRDGDFDEEDVWDVIRDGKTSNTSTARFKESSVSALRRLPTTSRMIPKASSHNYGSGSSSNNTHEANTVQQSAPVHIPKWSKAYGQTPKKNSMKSSWHNDCDDDADADDDDDDDDEFGNRDDNDEEEDYDAKEPPHEFIARRLARSQISSFSVFEGAGRTLKGRDLSKVRNAVLSRTGFLESL